MLTIEEIAQALGCNIRNAYSQLTTLGITGETRPDRGRRKFYPDDTVERIQLAKGSRRSGPAGASMRCDTFAFSLLYHLGKNVLSWDEITGVLKELDKEFPNVQHTIETVLSPAEVVAAILKFCPHTEGNFLVEREVLREYGKNWRPS